MSAPRGFSVPRRFSDAAQLALMLRRPFCQNRLCEKRVVPPLRAYCSGACRKAVRSARLAAERRSLAPYARRATR